MYKGRHQATGMTNISRGYFCPGEVFCQKFSRGRHIELEMVQILTGSSIFSPLKP